MHSAAGIEYGNQSAINVSLQDQIGDCRPDLQSHLLIHKFWFLKKMSNPTFRRDSSGQIHRPDFPLVCRVKLQQSFPETPRVDVEPDADFVAEQIIHANDTVNLFPCGDVLRAESAHLEKSHLVSISR